MLHEPPESPYDVQFRLLGCPIRVTWTFWLAGAVLGYPWVIGMARESGGSLDRVVFLLMWIGVVFASILLHEFGHVLAWRRYGIESSIVLYHFGGLAIPFGSNRPGVSPHRLGSVPQIIVSAAGPLAQLAVAAVVIVALIAWGQRVDVFGRWLEWIPGSARGSFMTSPMAIAAVDSLLFVNVFWPLLNLIPVWPLDGGRIAREVVLIFGGRVETATVLSLVAGIGMAVWGWSEGYLFLAILFGLLAFDNYQLLQSSRRLW